MFDGNLTICTKTWGGKAYETKTQHNKLETFATTVYKTKETWSIVRNLKDMVDAASLPLLADIFSGMSQQMGAELGRLAKLFSHHLLEASPSIWFGVCFFALT